MGLPVCYFRSSSLGSLAMCEHKYMIIYFLGLDEPSNLKADMGTAGHKAIELLALGQLYIQNNPETKTVLIEDEAFSGQFSREEWEKIEELSDDEVAKINKARKNKQIYTCDCTINNGHIRIAPEIVKKLTNASLDYYHENLENDFKPIDRRNVEQQVFIILDYMNGTFDPRKNSILAAELHFDVTIDQDWAYYEYDDPETSEKISGQLSLKGTIDLTLIVDDNTLNVVDFKFGQRKDWATGEVKDFDKLMKDQQLRLYYYALQKMYPGKDVMLTIFFARDGGPYTVTYTDEDMAKFENEIKQKFEHLQEMQRPKMLSANQKDFRCTKLCHFYKRKTKSGKNVCRFIRDEIDVIGIDEVIKKYKQKGHSFSHYKAPGSV